MRRFNRTITQRIGALDDHYLARSRPLGEARVLWEIGEDGRDVRALRLALDLDSGYLSRLLRSLEVDGLVELGAKPDDRRVRTAQLTAAGRRERKLLDRRSDDLARALLEPLSGSQRERLVAAMGEVERLLTAALVEIDVVDPASDDAQDCLRSYFEELDRRFEAGFDVARSLPAGRDELRPPHGLFLVARLRGQPIGCGGLRFHDGAAPDIKRMWVAPAVRGLGVGRRLLTDLEGRAAEAGHDCVRLETNRALVEAISLYRSSGYVEVSAFNDEAYGDHWFEKRL